MDKKKLLKNLYDVVEVLATVTIAVTLLYAFFVRLQIVDGDSMRNTLHDGERLLVSDLFFEPKRGDIVIIHAIDSAPYDRPIVKRVIATEGQTVDIDFDNWIVTVDGEVIEEDYRWLNPAASAASVISTRGGQSYPLTLGEGEIFVMGDNRYGSGDSRQTALGPVDVRCVVGKAFARVAPLSSFTIFENPFES